MNGSFDSRIDFKLWTKIVNQGCLHKLWTYVLKKSSEKDLWKKFWTIVVNICWVMIRVMKESYAQELNTVVVNKICEQKLWTKVVKTCCQQKLLTKAVNKGVNKDL